MAADPVRRPLRRRRAELADLLEVAVDLVRQAGRMTLDWFRSDDLEIERKGDGTPVTAADKAAEQFLRDEITARFPDDAIIGEEQAARDGRSGRTWIIDPIDGTKAFTHGVPLYTNLLAMNDADGPAIGVVNMPALGETVYAARGCGCFVDGRPARVSDRTPHRRLVPVELRLRLLERRDAAPRPARPERCCARGATATATRWSPPDGSTPCATPRWRCGTSRRCR